MKLQNIEIKGFKSFADKTVINFNKDITGIVGPNGCGKSNVVDAIRWVLGEQKTSALRSEKMENLIFNGTKKRRSSSLAEVSLTFENTRNILPTEYSTITISRHYYRNGESEYRLNNVPCRLKDITGMFMDTGIGSDSYAIIELGMIDDILNDKDNSRRKLFEQAAGIEKYKQRKKETMNKLSSTEADLNRVDDLLFEIEGNLKTLESQARRAKRYYKLKDQYKELSLELSILMLSDQKEAFKSINNRIEEEQDKKGKLESEIKKIESELEKEKAQNIEKEQLLSKKQKELNQKTSQIQETENTRNLTREKIKNARERKSYLLQQAENAKNQLTLLEETIQTLTGKAGDEKKALQTMERQLSMMKEETGRIRSQHVEQKEDLEEARQEMQSFEKTIYDKEKTIAVHKAQYENLQHEIKQRESDASSRLQQLEHLKEEMEELQLARQKESKSFKELSLKEEHLQNGIENNSGLIEKIKQELTSENRQLDAKRNEYQLTKNLIDNLEGFPESIKFLKKKVQYTKDAPLLSDIISCGEEYRAAIENFLEPFLNYYIVNTAEEAAACVNILSDSSKGRANFFILEEFKNYEPNFSFREDGALPALEILDIDKKYRSLAAYLLDRVFIVSEKDYDLAQQAMEGQDLVFLSKGGKFIRSKYALSGGAVGLFEGKKLGRVKNLEKLSKDIKNLEKKTLQINNKLNDLLKKQEQMKQSSYKPKIEAASRKLNELDQQMVSIQTRMENQENIITSTADKQQEISEKIAALKSADAGLQKELSGLAGEKSRLTETLRIQERKFQELSEELNASSENFNKANIEFHQQQNKLNSLQQELTYKQQQLEDAKNIIAHNEKESGELASKADELGSHLKENEALLETLYEEKEVLGHKVNDLEQSYFKSKGNINELEDKLRTIDKNKAQVETVLASYKDKINDLKLDLTSMKERLSVEFRVDINDLINQDPSGEYGLGELNEKVVGIKDKLDRFGEINPMAVEAFDEMKERYDFITGQKDDLVQAKKNLLQTIGEIDDTAKEKFLESFNAVRDHFQKVFRSLFTTEDNCDLLLSDPENPLESKIEIIAQPKGKRPLTINQLSGGEKTLTATALLFSLYLIKPAPFCVFDEVDAPLDDVNVGKFNKIIREFSKDSQFIIVTHNKQTMTAVDVIYGVTMAEEGVSSVVPVDFSSLN